MSLHPTTGRIRRTLLGKVHLRIHSTETIGCQDPLHCYKGSVHYGNPDFSVDATILPFEQCHGEALCNQLNSINSEFVLNVLTSVNGTNDRSGITFIAFPTFQKTYACYVEEGSDKTIEKGRLTEEFIDLTRDVIQGFIVLHKNGFYCPNFKGQHVAVGCKGKCLFAKIWNFCSAVNAEDKLTDWPILADTIEEAAANQGIVSLEVKDLCDKMRKGELIESEALKHCALLKVSQKFQKVLALNRYVLIFCKGQELLVFDDKKKSEVHTELLEFLTKNCYWTVDLPQWIIDVNDRLHQPIPSPENGETFIWLLSYAIEHEEIYQPYDKDDPDLESELRMAWQQLFLKVLNFAIKLNLKY